MKIGNVKVTITSESPTHSNKITDRPVEGGVVVDNISRNPLTLSISGVVTEGGFEALKQLRAYVNGGEIVKYSGRNVFGNMVIESLNTTHGANIKGGFGFSASLKQIKTATFVEVPFTSPVKSAGVVVPTQKAVNREIAVNNVNKYLIVQGQAVTFV
jgi:hypothetical protein